MLGLQKAWSGACMCSGTRLLSISKPRPTEAQLYMKPDWIQQLCPHIAARETLLGHVQGAEVPQIHILRVNLASMSTLRLCFVRLVMV